MDCITTSAHKFRTTLGFKQNDVFLTKEQSVLRKIMSSFEGESMQIQHECVMLHDYIFKTISSQ